MDGLGMLVSQIARHLDSLLGKNNNTRSFFERERVTFCSSTECSIPPNTPRQRERANEPAIETQGMCEIGVRTGLISQHFLPSAWTVQKPWYMRGFAPATVNLI